MLDSVVQAPDKSKPSDPDCAPVLARIAEYWESLGLTDAALIASLAEDCLAKAKRLVGRGSSPHLLRRALEEAQRRFDHALAAAIGLPPSNDPQPLAAARAALLLSKELTPDCLFAHNEATRQLRERLAHALPQPTPPEARVTMTPAPISFWLFTSTDSRP